MEQVETNTTYSLSPRAPGSPLTALKSGWRRRLPAVFSAVALAALLSWPPGGAGAADWPMWGGTPARNMVSPEKGLPATADIGKTKDEPDKADLSTTKNIKWIAHLGSESWGNVTVAGGRVFIGTNNGAPRSPKYKGNYGILLCLDEATGKFLWQLACPKLTAGENNDFGTVGLCSSPTVEHTPEGDRVYVVTNRCEVLCLDAAGMGAGNKGGPDANKGPFKDEAQYTAGRGNPPIEQGPGDADILWRFDMRDELGVFPRYITSSSVLVVNDRVYVTTSNGVDWTRKHIPSPNAPALICLDKKTGKLLGREASGISSRIYYCNWSSPAFGTVGGKPTIVFGGGDGYCYGFDPEPGADGKLKELWRFDCNPPEYKTKNGKPQKYDDPAGPSEILATPVVHDGKVYVAIGQDPEHPEGPGCLNCIDVSDPAKPHAVWQKKDVGRSMSTVAIADGLLYFADRAGRVYCLDPQTGKQFWVHDLVAQIYGSTLVADGKVYVGDENAELEVLQAGKQDKELGKVDLGQSVFSTPVAANGVLFVATGQNLFALTEKK
jgi:outer membrane protein assembly factor BamB